MDEPKFKINDVVTNGAYKGIVVEIIPRSNGRWGYELDLGYQSYAYINEESLKLVEPILDVEKQELYNIVDLVAGDKGWECMNGDAMYTLALRMREQHFSFNEIEKLLVDIFDEVASEKAWRMQYD